MGGNLLPNNCSLTQTDWKHIFEIIAISFIHLDKLSTHWHQSELIGDNECNSAVMHLFAGF